MLSRTHLPLATACATSALLGGFLAAHGNYVKAAFNVVEGTSSVSPRWTAATSKANGSTRGSATTQSTTLYAMDPPLNHHGTLDAQGWRIVATDEDAATLDSQFKMSYVKYASNGVDPDTSPFGELHSYQFWFFFGGLTGRRTMEFEITFGSPIRITERNHGIAVRLPDNASWPSDGLSVAGQFNLPNDPLRPRVPAPFDQQVWTYEMPALTTTAVPLGGRTLDTLQFGTLFAADPVLKTFVRTNAYGTGVEDLYGPESMHPDASRGDQLGFFLQSATDGQISQAVLFAAPSLLPNPFPIGVASGNNPYLWLGLPPLQVFVGAPDPGTGQLRFPPIPFALFPAGFRKWYFQAAVVIPAANLLQLTDAVGIDGI